jgi:hypothetical protein
LEPQGQILWQHVGFNHDFDGFQTVNLGSTNGWTGRLGLLAKSTIVTGSGQVWQPYVRGNIWESWGAEAETTFGGSPIQVPLLEQATWVEFAGGGTVKVNANWSAYGPGRLSVRDRAQQRPPQRLHRRHRASVQLVTCAVGAAAERAEQALRVRPHSGAYRLFIELPSKGRSGSSLCENSTKFCKGSSRANFFAIFPILNALRSRKSERNRFVWKHAGIFTQARPNSDLASCPTSLVP